MNIEITELGYIKSAKINLDKELIVLCGPNNSGKTYIAYLIYGLMKFRTNMTDISKLRDEISKLIINGTIEIDLFDHLEKNLKLYIEEICKKYKSNIQTVFASDENTFKNTDIHKGIYNLYM